MELFRLLGVIAIDSSRAEAAIDDIGNRASGLGSSMQDTGAAISKVGGKLTKTFTVAGTAIGGFALKATADFESAMSEVGAISGASGDDLKKLEEKAKSMGASTKFSATESAEALKYMAMAGWKTEDMLGGLEGIMNLAAASGENLGTTSDIVTDALTAFGLSASDSGHFADLLAKASSNANTNVSMMGETFKYVAPVAGALGFSAEDVALAVGLMANSGIKASQAGTSLRASLTNLADPTKEMSNVMVSLGLATEDTATVIDSGKLQKAQTKVENKTIDMEKAQIKYNDAVSKYGASSSQAQTAALNLEKAENNLESAISELNETQKGATETTGIHNNLLIDSAGNTKSFHEVMVSLRSAFKGLTEEQQAQAAATLFGKEAMSGMLAIINASDDDFNKLVSAINDCDGAAKTMADTMNDNLSGQIVLLKSQLEGLAIQFVELIMPYLKQGVEWLSKVLTWISNLDDGTKKLILTIGGIVVAAGPVLKLVGSVVSGIGGILRIGGQLSGGIGRLTHNTATLLGVGKSVISGIGSLVTKIGSALVPAVSGVVSLGGKLVTGIGSLVGKIAGALIPAIASIGTPVLAVTAVVGGLVVAGIAVYKHWDELCAFASECWEGIKNAVGTAVEGIKNFFSGLGEAVAGAVGSVVDKAIEMRDKVVEKFTELKDNAAQKVTEMKDALVEKATELKERVTEKFHDIKESIVEKFTGLRESVVEKFTAMKDGAIEAVNDMREKVVEKYEEIKSRVADKISELKDATVERFNELKEKATERISEMRDKVSETVASMKEKVGAKFSELVSSASERISGLHDAVVGKFTEVKEKAIEAIGNLKESAVEKFGEIKEGVAEKIDGLKGFVVDTFGEIAEKAGSKLAGLADKVSSIFDGIKNAAASAMSSFGGTIMDTVSNAGSAIKDKLGSAGEAIGSTFEKVGDKISGSVEKAKGLFDMDWKLPEIKTPHFSVGGTKEVFGLKLPDIDVDWYAEGGVMTKPTAFGIDPNTGKLQAGGEAGPEAVAPISVLQDYIRAAVNEANGDLAAQMAKACSLLNQLLDTVKELAGMGVVLDTGAMVGALAVPMGTAITQAAVDKKRGR